MTKSKILFTCVGTSDPVRGYRDGGMLHIMRHFRPAKIYIFLSAEMEAYEHKDQRFSKTFQFARDNWEGYDPQVVWCHSKIENVADLDAVHAPMMAFFQRAVRENPDAQILINLSSGSPQMKIILAQLTLQTQYSIKGIQVRNPESSSGSSERTNIASYAVEEELELNEDNDPSQEPRLTEPQMLALHRTEQFNRIKNLLDSRDYKTLVALSETLPEKLQKLLLHLEARNNMKPTAAKDFIRGLQLPFNPYPIKTPSVSQPQVRQQYQELSEYFLLLRNLQLSGRYSEFVLRLNPFLTTLTYRLLELSLPCPISSFMEEYTVRRQKRIRLNPDKLANVLPREKQELEKRLGVFPLEYKDISLHVLVHFLHVLGKQSDTTMDLLDACLNLNSEQRNSAAHQLHAITEQDIRDYCVDTRQKHYKAVSLINQFWKLLRSAYPDYWDNDLLTIYDRCADYIREQLTLEQA